MQPTQKFKKPLLASALILGICNTYIASAENFTIKATGIPDVVAAPVAGFTTLAFGATLKGSKIGGSCKIIGASGLSDEDMKNDFNLDGNLDAPTASDALFGSIAAGTISACNTDAVGTKSGAAAIIEIDGVANSTVSISIPDVSGTGWRYTPSSESCYVNYGGTASADPCTSLATGIATGVNMAAAYATETDGSIADNYDADSLGKVRMALAGEIFIEAPGLTPGVPVTDSIVVTITYE